MTISHDSYAMLLLCSDLAIKSLDNGVKAFTTSQWSKLADRLIENKLTPKAFFELSAESMKQKLNLTDDMILRIEKLLSRAGQFGIELEALNEKGIFTLTRCDSQYPAVFKNKFKKLAPPVLYYAGNLSLLKNKGISIVGSRNIDHVAMEFTKKLSTRCTNDGLNIVSGGARGVDSIAENAANSSDGTTVIVVADSLERKIRKKEAREALIRKQSLIISPFRPDMPFKVYAAMERNKYVYALSNFAVIVSSDFKKGGTWSGAIENLKQGWIPMFVRKAEDMPEGNTYLLNQSNVYPITEDTLNNYQINIFKWFSSQSKKYQENLNYQQLSLF